MSKAQRPVILMYHRVADEKFDPWGLAVAPDRFAEQLGWLATRRNVMHLSEFAELHRGARLPDDAVAITFDDGYACTAKVAAPMLERLGMPATIFLPAGLIGHQRLFWWDELRLILMSHSAETIRAMGHLYKLGQVERDDEYWPRDARKRTPRQRAFYRLWSELQALPPEQIELAMAELRTQQSIGPLDEAYRLMSEEELRSIRSTNIQVGSHAVSHASLPALTSARKTREIHDSIGKCLDLVGSRPLTFAYPFGDFDDECETIVGDAGFACACTVEPRAVAPDDRPFALPRLKVGNWSWRRLRRELTQAIHRTPEVAERG